MRDFEEKRETRKSARETGRGQLRPPPNPAEAERSATKGSSRESAKSEPMVLTPETMDKGKTTATDRAAHKPRISTVTDGEAG